MQHASPIASPWRACLSIALLAWTWPAAGATQTHYRVRFDHVPTRSLRARLVAASDTVALLAHAPPSHSLLLRRAEGDLPRLRDLLRSHGYLAARVTAEVRAATPPEVVFRVHSGPLFRVDRIALSLPPLRSPKPSRIGLSRRMPAVAARLLEAEERLLDYARARGHPYPVIANRLYRARPDEGRLDIALDVATGPAALFGPVTVTGTQSVAQEVVRHALRWRSGRRYDATRVEDTRVALIRSGLFASVEIAASNRVPPDALLPLTVAVRERRHRTVEAGASYQTDTGPGAKFLWEHRNLGGHAERLSALAEMARDDARLEVACRLPRLAHQNQTLTLSLNGVREATDGYASDHLRALCSLSRRWIPDWQADAGAALHYLISEEDDLRTHQTLLSLPLAASWGRSDNLLDPTRGLHIALTLQPFTAIAGDASRFLKAELGVQHYLPLDSRGARVMAARLRGGGIVGEQRMDLPPNERFYAGGGGSIRGYAYQGVGPRRGDDPSGGRSVVEASLELRTRLTRRTGAVAFVDAGNAYDTQLPNLGERLFYGAGLGFRYFTPIGPLRADVALPLNRRPDIDSPLQVYISIGQSF